MTLITILALALLQVVPNAVSADRKISSSDLLSVLVLNERDASKPAVRVGSDGTVNLPLLRNRLRVEGLLPREAEVIIARGFIDEMILVHPSVSVTVLEYAVRQVGVVGDVAMPGQFDIVEPISLVDALAKAGGTTTDAGAELVVIKPSVAPRRINISQLQSGGDEALNIMLSGGEVISVPDAPKVWVTGRVTRPQAVPLRDPAKATVLNVVGSVEGQAKSFSKTAYIFRADRTGKRTEIPIPLRDIMQKKAPDVPMQADDILLIPDDNGVARRGVPEDPRKQSDVPPDEKPAKKEKAK